MASKQITQSDLDNLEKKIKIDFTEQETERRHEQWRRLQDAYNAIDSLWDDIKDVESNNKLLEQSIKTMNDNFAKLERTVTDWFNKIYSKIDSLPSKEAHEENKRRIEELENEYKEQDRKIQGINIKLAGWTASGSIISWLAALIISHYK